MQDGQTLERLRKKIYRQMIEGMEGRILDNHRLFLLHNRCEPQKEDHPKTVRLGLRHYLMQVSNVSHWRAITKLICGEDSYRLHADHDIPREERTCRKCLAHIESPQHVLLQCPADLLTCALRRNLLELLQDCYSIHIPAAPFTDDQSTSLLWTIIFHWDAIPWTAQFVYRVHCIWCGKGWSAPVQIVPDARLAVEEVLDSDHDYDQAEDDYDQAEDVFDDKIGNEGRGWISD
jgi:hypothetical protein